ncbi:hypothetical protein SDC9_101770 [bioreactor metagenome]|uniref:Uncharacterized protein n=1 Tax=bioreactor metagenome TaxID=1076179 RepID=A0A645APJ9_9ZZZZ
MDPGRHQIVAGAFRRTRGQDRGLKFMETLRGHVAAHRGDDFGAQHDILVQAFAAQIEEAVFQPQRLRRSVILRHLKRQHFAVAENFHRFGRDFDFTGRQLGVDGFRSARHHLAGEGEHGFNPPAVERLIKILLRVDHHLGDAVVVAQIDENHAAVVAYAVHPAGNPDRFSDFALANPAARMSPKLFHNSVF